MSTYAVVNMSGSVGKTTSVVTAAILLAEKGMKVRVIDLDAQANATSLLGYANYTGPSVGEVLCGRAAIADVELPARLWMGDTEDGEPVYRTIENLTLVPATRNGITRADVELPTVTGGVLQLAEALEAAEIVDVTLMDCAGSFTPVALAGVLATAAEVDEDPRSYGVISCTKPSGKENEGIPKLEEELVRIRKTFKVDVGIRAVITTQVRRGEFYTEQYNDLVGAYGEAACPTIRFTTVPDKSYTNRVPLPFFGYQAKAVLDDYVKAIDQLQGIGMLLPPPPPEN